jgi:N-acetylmuramoyl-L-alanine amidase
MQFNRTFFIGLLLLIFLLPAGFCHAGSMETYQKARRQYDLLLASQKKQLYRDNWERVIDRFVDFAKRNPTHAKAPSAVYLAGKASQRLYGISRKQSDIASAVAFYKRLASSYPDSSLADDGLVLAAGAVETQQKQLANAYLLYRQAADRYPKGDMIRLAQEGTRRLAAYAPVKVDGVGPPPSVRVSAVASDKRELQAIRHWASPEYTRIVLELNGPVRFGTGSLPGNPAKGIEPRIYIDLQGTRIASGIDQSMVFSEGLLRQIRTAPQPDNRARVVLDLTTKGEFKAFALPDPDRIVIDIGTPKHAVLAANPDEIRSLPTAKGDPIAKVLEQTPEERQPQVRLPKGGSNQLRRIVVDAGHGGKDPGAIGPRGTKEKDVTLALAHVLAKRLKKEFGCQVVLTRDKDVYLALEERTALANRIGADLFISIHANASTNRSVRGVETYYLNFSKNDKAAAVAARENGTSLKQVGDLEMILFDLMANSKINESSRLAAEIQSSLVGNLGRHYSEIKDHGVRQGPFYVLLGATMPSVLVETAFISNKAEEDRLKNSKFQGRAADAIVAGVKKFAKDSRMIATK